MKLFFAFALVFVAVQASGNLELWIARGKANAERDMDVWTQIAKDQASGSNVNSKIAAQLKVVREQLADADENSNALMGRVGKVIKAINVMLRGDPNLLQRVGLRALVGLLDGRRDNKSYYLYDGAQDWAGRRAAAMDRSNPASEKLAKELEALQAKALEVRELLEVRAQTFVAGLKTLRSMTGEVKANLEAMKKTADDMSAKSTPESNAEFLDASSSLLSQIDELIKNYS